MGGTTLLDNDLALEACLGAHPRDVLYVVK